MKMFTITWATLTFYLKKVLFFLHFEKPDTTFSLSTLMSLCTVISTNAVNLSSAVLHRRYVFSIFRVEKLLSTEAVVAGNTIKLNSKTFWRGPSPPVPLPCLRH